MQSVVRYDWRGHRNQANRKLRNPVNKNGLDSKYNGYSMKCFDHTLHVCDERNWRRQNFNQGYKLRNSHHNSNANKCGLYLSEWSNSEWSNK